MSLAKEHRKPRTRGDQFELARSRPATGGSPQHTFLAKDYGDPGTDSPEGLVAPLIVDTSRDTRKKALLLAST